tara:strand:- start:197 stop:865 length:669 start_codon:yes stop_codon:yes gene_type:complete
MAYIPLNKIVTNIITDGNEYQFPNGQIYRGFYWKNYKGEFFTGKTPNDSPTLQIFPISNQTNPGDTPLPFTQNASLYNEIWETYEGPYSVTEDLKIYNKIKNINIQQIRKSPYQTYPQPNPKDYKLGVFQRFFCVKVNEDNYLEIDAEIFTSLRNQDEKWDWELYTPFRISWILRGNQEEVERTNYNVTLLAEKSLKRKGFQRFLRYNYSKFYLPNPTSPSS